jgi:hypothetical protein
MDNIKQKVQEQNIGPRKRILINLKVTTGSNRTGKTQIPGYTRGGSMDSTNTGAWMYMYHRWINE